MKIRAFPSTLPAEHLGMDLRDYFAAAALQALISRDPINFSTLDWPHQRALAKQAYEYADCMMERREK